MRTALISDIHGNLQALMAVLEDVSRRRVDRLICLGDVVGYGAEPNACLAEVRRRAKKILAGNHDWGAVDRLDLDYFNRNARIAAQWTRRRLSPDERRFLASLDITFSQEGPGGFIAVHSTPVRPQDWHYILSIDEAEYQLEHMDRDLCFVGHSHQPVFWQYQADGRCVVAGREYLHLEPGRRYIVNVGSVGQPRDGDPRAAYAIYDQEQREVIIQRVQYDVDTARRQILEAGLPMALAERLIYGI